MGQYNKAVLTTAGEKLIARALAGEIKLNITKAKTSDFAYPENADLKRLTDMQGVRQTVCDPETVVFNETIIQTRVLFSNEDIASTYYIHNIGLYAMDGTHEVLFSIVTAEMPDEMPQYNGVASTSYIYNIQNVVQDAAQLNISLNPSGTATIQDVLERVDATSGDISETVIETLETVEDKYPVPAAGESVKRFFGKIITFMKNIKPLTGDINIYVSANTGSDITGDGNQDRPYFSITKALEMAPKDLNGYKATIFISGGTYNEDLTISGFGTSGYLMFSLSGNVTIGHVLVRGSLLTIGSSVTETSRTFTMNSLTITDGSNFNAWSNVYISTVSKQSLDTIGNNYSIAISRNSSAYVSGITTLGGNNGTAIRIHTMSKAYFYSISGSGFNIGIAVETNSQLSSWSNNILATTPIYHDAGGMIIHPNGTQIAGIFTSGLSCTWGTLSGGYIRNGNAIGTAMITIALTVTITTALSAGTQYFISGFPQVAGTSTIAVSVHDKLDVYYCFLYHDGRIELSLINPLSAGSFLVFNCTYMTTS
ncbi:hypothetical protein BXY41_101226 [Lacrimispora xylanisolvens]|uniref:DUF1565 domain-containing protein n=1 Tax=Lacrimispora xylanisolvens TaxID=384636 RepID=A0A2S6HYD1_9FIRM|nr:hypothetical protein [Hungatella xylanolytica]PPK83163.1 hypothetical protein BXY41_101226 [Hungatella xylanolytica]